MDDVCYVTGKATMGHRQHLILFNDRMIVEAKQIKHTIIKVEIILGFAKRA